MPFLTEKLLPERYRADLAALVGITQPAAIVTYAEFEPEVRAALKAGDSVRAVLVSEHIEGPSAPDFAALGGLRRAPEDIVLLAALFRHHRAAKGRGALAPRGA